MPSRVKEYSHGRDVMVLLQLIINTSTLSEVMDKINFVDISKH